MAAVVYSSTYSVAKMLLQAGARFDLRNADGQSFLRVAKYYMLPGKDYDEMMKLIKRKLAADRAGKSFVGRVIAHHH